MSEQLLKRKAFCKDKRVKSATDKTAAIVSPFEKGPVSLPILIENEQDLNSKIKF